MANALTAKYEPLLVSWSTSGRLEEEAQEVHCLTPNLAWLVADDHLLKLINDVARNSEQQYQYLCFTNDIQSNDQELIKNISKVRSLLSAEELRRVFSARQDIDFIVRHVQDAIKVKLLLKRSFINKSEKIERVESTNGSEYISCEISQISTDLGLREWRSNALHLPLPGDLVVYSNVDLSKIFSGDSPPKDAVVISRQIVASSTLSNRRPEDEYDLILPHADQVAATKTWFKEMWDQ